MKKIILSLFLAVSLAAPSLAATWSAVDRVPTVGKQVLTKNSLPTSSISGRMLFVDAAVAELADAQD